MTYPSVADPDGAEADRLSLAGLPGTVFYDRRGRRVDLHQGQYLSAADLRAAVAALL